MYNRKKRKGRGGRKEGRKEGKHGVLDPVGEGERGMIWENGIETCIISYKKLITSPGLMQDTGCWGWCTGMTQRDGTGREM